MQRSNPFVIYVTNIRWCQNVAEYIVVTMWHILYHIVLQTFLTPSPLKI